MSWANKIKKQFNRFLIEPSDFFYKFMSFNLFLYLSFAWFSFQALFFAFTTRFGLPPDEVYHLEFIKLFVAHSPSPFLSNQGVNNLLLEVSRNPFFLYHYLMSFPYKIVEHFSFAFIFVRLFSVLLGLASLYMVVRISNTLNLPKLTRNLSVFMLSNTLMFVFIFGSISYDSLFIFLSLTGIFLTLNLVQKINARYLLLLILTIATGLLTKVNFLPMAAIILVTLLVNYYSKVPEVLKEFKISFKLDKKINVIVCFLIGLVGILLVQRYAVNLIQYKSFQPDCSKLRSIENCRQSALYKRNEQVFGPDRQPANLSFLGYGVSWLVLMQERTFGIFAHEQFNPSKIVTIWLFVVVAIGSVAAVRLWSKKDQKLSVALFIAFAYTAVLFLTNYRTYLASGRRGFTVHGRYLFGILPIFYLALNYYTFKFFKSDFIKSCYIILTIVIFILASLPTYLHKTSPDWYDNQFRNTVVKLKRIF